MQMIFDFSKIYLVPVIGILRTHILFLQKNISSKKLFFEKTNHFDFQEKISCGLVDISFHVNIGCSEKSASTKSGAKSGKTKICILRD